MVEADRLWADPAAVQRKLGPRAETETLLALRRGARAWPPLGRLLQEAAPDQLHLSDDEALDLLGDATDALRVAGIDVHWPRELVKALTARAEIGQPGAPGSAAPSLLGADALLDFRWQISLDGQALTEAEMDALAEARRPLIRLRDQWVVADPKLVARAKRRRGKPLSPMEALSVALTGEVKADGETRSVTATGAFAALIDRIRDPQAREPVPQPAALKASLRDYQLRALAWLADMCELGLGGCLADAHGPGQDHHPARPASAPYAGPGDRGAHPGGLPDLAAGQLAARARAGHTAALLDGEMPENLVEDARAAGVPLLPLPTELDPGCSSPDWGYPCKHAAALCYAIASGIDADPFVLFALRGRTKEKVFAELRRRRIPAPASYRAPALAADPPPDSGLTADGLQGLAADTAARAARLLAGDTASAHLTRRADALRPAADHRSAEWFHRLQAGTGLRPLEFARLVRAWRHGGDSGVTTALEPLTPEPAVMAAARGALDRVLAEIDDTAAPPRLRSWRNRLTLDDAGLQLRIGPDAHWYPYAREDGEWWPCAPCAPDPVAALTAVWDRRQSPGVA